MHLRVERIIYSSRWLLTPLYVGLILVLFAYVVRMVLKLAQLFHELLTISDSEFLLNALCIIEMVMVANFLVMVIIGGFALFIQQLSDHDRLGELKWLDHMTPGGLKLKLIMSLLGVSSVHLLEALVNAEHLDNQHLARLVVVHLVFIISTIAIAWTNRLSSH
jgi:uncharacterized protein (TIGR00645 family)